MYPNVFSAARSITDAAGTRGLFTGYLPTLLEDVPDMAFKFAAYESLRSLRLRLMKGRKASPQVCLLRNTRLTRDVTQTHPAPPAAPPPSPLASAPSGDQLYKTWH